MTSAQRLTKLEDLAHQLVLEASQASSPEVFRAKVHRATQLQQEIRHLKAQRPEATK